MAQTQCGNLCAPAVEESIITDLESGGSLLGSSRKDSPDLVLAVAFDNDDLQPKAASRRLRTLDIVLQNPWDLWVHEQGDLLGCGKEFMQQLQPLWSVAITVTPVALPPGRLRLATSPVATGSEAVVKTIGMVWVAAIAARTPSRLPPTKITSTLRLTRSAAKAGIRSN